LRGQVAKKLYAGVGGVAMTLESIAGGAGREGPAPPGGDRSAARPVGGHVLSAAGSSEVQCGHRLAAIGTAVAQNGQFLVVAALGLETFE
jgi:hypothetical protein